MEGVVGGWYFRIQSYTIQSYMIQSYMIQSYMIQSYTIQSYTVINPWIDHYLIMLHASVSVTYQVIIINHLESVVYIATSVHRFHHHELDSEIQNEMYL